jgi:3-hydroxybutyryl-CoA dehydrogenase
LEEQLSQQLTPSIDPDAQKPEDCKAGVVGLGLMGTSIATCLLAGGHPVIGIETDAVRRKGVNAHVLSSLKKLAKEGFLKRNPNQLIKKLSVSSCYAHLADAEIVVESTTESLPVKIRALREIEKVVSPRTLIGTNTSAIPITRLQKRMAYPERVLGMHWDEPAHVTIFMEIIQGGLTSPLFSDVAVKIAEQWWGKEPSCVRRDIKGFITNRISYAMFREACYLVDSGAATIEDVDRSLRNDVGWWMALVGPFRYMDLMGVRAYRAVMRGLLPDLSCGKNIPRVMHKATRAGGNGISTGKGFYSYTPADRRVWEKRFVDFTYEMRRLAEKYRAPEEPSSRSVCTLKEARKRKGKVQ